MPGAAGVHHADLDEHGRPRLIGGTDGHPYQASIDVTAQVAAAGNGTYWVGRHPGRHRADRYAGWSLVVAYRNPSLPLRDLSIFEGFADVTTTTGNSSRDDPGVRVPDPGDGHGQRHASGSSPGRATAASPASRCCSTASS